MTKTMLKAAVVLAATISSAPVLGQSPGANQRVLGYFLPRTRAVANVSQRIRRCPTPEQHEPLVVTDINIEPQLGPDPTAFIRVDARSGFLAGRTTKLALRADGTLSSFNVSSTGEGGDVLSALITVGATVASFGVGLPIPLVAAAPMVSFSEDAGPPPPPLNCKPEIQRMVNRMAQVEFDLANLRSRIAAGNESAASAATLEALTGELAELIDGLTLSSDGPAKFNPGPGDIPAHPPGVPVPAALIQHIPAIDYSGWFEEEGAALAAGLRTSKIAGLNGFRAGLTADGGLFDLLGQGDQSPALSNPTRNLYYRRPVPAAVAVRACGAAWSGNDCAEAQTGPDAGVAGNKRILFPQLSGLFSISIGEGSIFGTRQAGATFDEQGAPTALEYGSTSGGAAIAGVINAAGTGATTLHNAQSAAVTRRLADEKARRELQTLFDTPFPAPTPAPAAGGN